MGAFGVPRTGLSRHGEYLAALLSGLAGRNEGATGQRRFNNDCPEAHSADDAVAVGEVALAGFHVHGKLGNDGPASDNVLHKLCVLRRIDNIHATPQYRDGAPARFERATMGSGINAHCHPADDGDTPDRQFSGQFLRHAEAVRGGAPSPYQCDVGLLVRREVSASKKE